MQCSKKPTSSLTLALVTSVSIGCFALKICCTSCSGLRGKATENINRSEVELKEDPATECWRGGERLRSELLPSLEKVLGRHFSGLEKLVEHHWKFHCNVLESTAVSVHTRNTHMELARDGSKATRKLCLEGPRIVVETGPSETTVNLHRDQTTNSFGVPDSGKT